MVAHAHRQKSRRSESSRGARGGTAGAAARYESAQKCWRLPARNPADCDGPGRAPCTWQSCLPPCRQGPCPGCRGEGALLIPVRVPRRSARTVVPHTEVIAYDDAYHRVLRPSGPRNALSLIPITAADLEKSGFLSRSDNRQ